MLTKVFIGSIIHIVLKRTTVGVDDAEGPPVPIPNTEVKLSGAENTWLETAWKDREMPTQSDYTHTGVLLYIPP